MKRARVPTFLLVLAGCPSQPAIEPDDTGEPVSSSSNVASTTELVPTTAGESTAGELSTDVGTTAAPEPFCGDAIVNGDELCDDGNAELDDGCDPQCKPQAVVLWTQSWDGAAAHDDYVEGLAVDGEGNIYVAGSVEDAAFQADALLRKLDPGGTELLSFSYAGPAGLDDAARAVAVGPDGSIYLAGFEYLAENTVQGWLRKYDATGEPLWVHTRMSAVLDGSAAVYNVVLGGEAAYLVGGEDVGDTNTRQYFVQRLAAGDGAEVWTELITGAVPVSKVGLAATAQGELLVAGGVFDAMEQAQPWVGMYDPDGALLWSNTNYLVGGGYAVAAAVGPAGELAVAGVGFQFDDNNFWLARLDPMGAVVWEDYISSDGLDAGRAVAFGPGGDLYVGGYRNVSKQLSNTLVRRYAPDGLPYWTDQYNDLIDLYDSVTSVVVTPTMVVAAGSELVAKHGANQWIRAFAP